MLQKYVLNKKNSVACDGIYLKIEFWAYVFYCLKKYWQQNKSPFNLI